MTAPPSTVFNRKIANPGFRATERERDDRMSGKAGQVRLLPTPSGKKVAVQAMLASVPAMYRICTGYVPDMYMLSLSRRRCTVFQWIPLAKNFLYRS